MNIGIFTDQYYPQVSGVVISIKNLYEALEALGHKCYVFCDNVIDGSLYKDELATKNIINFKGIKYPFKVLRDYTYTFRHKKFLKIIKEYKLDIIHLNTEFNISKIARIASKRLNIPIVYTAHTAWCDYIKTLLPHLDKIIHKPLVCVMRHLYTKKASKCAKITIFPTKKMLRDIKDYGINLENIEILPTGLDLTRFDRNNLDINKIEALREKYNLKNKTVYLFLGRIAKEKNIEEVIRNFAKVFKDNKNVCLLIVGDGPHLETIKKLARDYKIIDSIIFTGMISWSLVPYYYQLASYFINASSSETQGLTYIESLASGIPIIAKKDLCIENVLIDNYNSLLFETENEFIDKLKYSYQIKDSLTPFKENSILSSFKFSKEEFAKNALILYEKAIMMQKEFIKS